ncbi:MAG: hypothetical protein JWM40_2951 [Frankiales bacterium]|nr:hypothetical protein [Frankiales bacterium]
MTAPTVEHDRDCPASVGCCPNDEYGCVLHAEPPCNCGAGTVLPCGCVPPCEGHHEDDA